MRPEKLGNEPASLFVHQGEAMIWRCFRFRSDASA